MRRIAGFAFVVAMLAVLSLSCESEKPAEAPSAEYFAAVFHLSAMPDPSANSRYQAWYVPRGTPTDYNSLGTFDATVDSLQVSLGIDFRDVGQFIVTLEPNPDGDPDPSATIVMIGEVPVSNTAYQVNLGFPYYTAFANDDTTFGLFTLFTRTDGDTTNDSASLEHAGFWWMGLDTIHVDSTPIIDSLTGDTLNWIYIDSLGDAPGLHVPVLSGWQYESWAVFDTLAGAPTAYAYLSMGKFTDPDSADSGNPYILGAGAPPNVPGEEFLAGLPAWVTPPVNLSNGWFYALTVEPLPDDSSAPFGVQLFYGSIPAALDSFYAANRSLDFPVCAVDPVRTN